MANGLAIIVDELCGETLMCGHLERERCSLKVATQFNINAVLHPERSARDLRGIYREIAVKRRNSIHRVRLQSPNVNPGKRIEHLAGVEEGKYDSAVLIVGDRLCYRVFAS